MAVVLVAAVAGSGLWFINARFDEAFGGDPPIEKIDDDFQRNLKDREMIVAQVKAGKLTERSPYNSHVIRLPERYRHLSHGGGEIVVYGDQSLSNPLGSPEFIIFFTYRGVVDNWSGFVWSEDGEDLTRWSLGGDLVEINRKGKHWFWVSAT